EGFLKVWDRESGKEKQVMRYSDKSDYAQHLGLSPDGKTITVYSRNGGLVRLDLATGRQLRNSTVTPLTLSPDGRFAFRHADVFAGRAQLIDVDSSATVGVVQMPQGMRDSYDRYNTSFSPDGRLFAGLLGRSPPGQPTRIIFSIWETTGGPPIVSIPTTAFYWVPHAFSRDGRLFAFAERDALRV